MPWRKYMVILVFLSGAAALTQAFAGNERSEKRARAIQGDGLDHNCGADAHSLGRSTARQTETHDGNLRTGASASFDFPPSPAPSPGAPLPFSPDGGFGGNRLVIQANGVVDTPDSYLASPNNGKHTDGKLHGHESILRVGRSGTWRWATVLEADISAIPIGSRIYDVRLDLHCLTASASPLACRISKMTRPGWSEVTCNWTHFASVQPWAALGGDAHPALFMPWPLHGQTGPCAIQYDKNLVDIAQDALDHESGRLRLLIHLATLGGFGEGFNDFASSEATDASLRPKFTIDYALPVPETSLAALGPAYRAHGTTAPVAVRFGCASPSTHPQTWLTVPPHTMRFAPVLLTGYSDGAWVDGEGLNGSSLRPVHASPGFSIAVQSVPYANGPVYRRPLGNSTSAWTRCGSNETFVFVWAFPGLDPAGREVWIGMRNGTMHRSVDLGDSWQPVPSPPTLSPEGYYHSWSFAASPDGHAIVVEYGVTPPETPGQYACHTADWGNTWTVAINADTRWPASIPKHFHAAQWLPDAELFITDTGDDYSNRRIVTISSDGTVITDIVPAPIAEEQPTWFEPIPGNVQEVLYGSDNYSGVGILNIFTGVIRQLYYGWPGTPVTSHVFQMWRHDGLYYASQHLGDLNVRNAYKNYSEIIAAASPAGPWSVVHRFPVSNCSRARSYAGFSGGKMAIGVWDDLVGGVRHLAMTPIQTETRTAIVIEPARANVAAQDLPNLNNWAPLGAGTTTAIVPGGGVNGANCVEIQTNGTTGPAGFTRINGGFLEAGRSYQLSMKLWSDADVLVSVMGSAQPHFKAGNYFLLTRNQWTPVSTRLIQGPAGGSSAMFDVRIDAEQSANLGPVRLRCDEVILERSPCTSFTPATASRDVTALEFDYQVGANWTDVFWIAPAFNSWHLFANHAETLEAGRKLYVRTYEMGPAAVKLWWRPGRTSTLAAPPVSHFGTVTFTLADAVLDVAMIGEWVEFKTGGNASIQYQIKEVLAPNVFRANAFGSGVQVGSTAAIYSPRFGVDVSNEWHSETREFAYQYLAVNSPVGIAVRLGSTDGNPYEQFLHVDIMNAGRLAQAVSAPLHQYPELSSGLLTVRCGEISRPEDTLPARFVFDGMYGGLSDEQVFHALNLDSGVP